MAIAVDVTSQASQVTDTSITWSHTCTGSNLILFVGIGIPTADTITGVTYNSVGMTQAGVKQVSGDRFVYLYYLVGPATGAHNIVASSSGSQILRGAAVSYTGVSQGAIDQTPTTNSGNSATPSGTITTVSDNCWVIMVCKTNADQAAGASTTARVALGGDTTEYIYDTNTVVHPAGSTTLNVTATSQQWATITASFAPASPAVNTSGNYGFFM